MKTNMSSVALAGCMLFIMACSQGNSEKKESTNPAKEAPPTQIAGQSGITDDVSEKNIVQTAMASKDHSTLVTAVKAAELVDVLSGQGPFTVFAPTNEAFSKLPAGTVEGLLKPDKKIDLQDILQYHVTVGVYQTDALLDGQILGLANGGTMKITKKDGKIRVNGVANVIGSIKVSNGVIHVIDAVLLPKECCVSHNSQWCNVCD